MVFGEEVTIGNSNWCTLYMQGAVQDLKEQIRNVVQTLRFPYKYFSSETYSMNSDPFRDASPADETIMRKSSSADPG